MAEETNDDSLFQNHKITTKEPFDISRKCVSDCASELDNLNISVDSMRANELSILDMNGEDGESIWLAADITTNEGVENEWLKSELDLTGLTLEKNSLIDKLDTLARTSVDMVQTPSKDTNERSLPSPPILPTNLNYLISQPVSNDAIISQPVSSTPAAKSPGGKLEMFLQEDDTDDTNSTIISSDQPLNSTFNKESINSTFNKEVSPPTVNGLNSTFSKDEEQNLNSTFVQEEGNATFDQTGNINATFDLSKEKSNTSVDSSERTDSVTIDTESDLKGRSPSNCVSESSVKVNFSNDSNNSECHNSNPASLAGQPGSEIQPKPDSKLGGVRGDSIHPLLPRTRLPPPSRLQAPPQPRYPPPVRRQGPRSTPPIPREATVPAPASGKIRNGLRPPRNVFKPPTAVHKTGLRQPAQVQDRTFSLPTSQQPNDRLRPQSGLRPSAPVVETGLRKPSGIARPSFLARPSGPSRPVGGAIPGGSRQGKNKTSYSENNAPGRTSSGSLNRLTTG